MKKVCWFHVYKGVCITKLKACYSFLDAEGNMILSRTLEETKAKIDKIVGYQTSA